jgi:hypothetical protein
MAKRTVHLDYQAVLKESRARVVRLAERRGAARIRPLFDSAVSDLERAIARSSRKFGDETFDAQRMNVALAQLRQAQVMLERRLAGEIAEVAAEAQAEAIHGLSRSISRLERRFRGAEVVLPLDEASVIHGLVSARRDELDEMHRAALKGWGEDLFIETHQRLALSLATGESVEDAIARVPEDFAGGWPRAERIVRTETASAYGVSSMDAAAEASEELPDLMLRWSEHCDDEGEPLDDRVGADSIAMHGQLAAPGGWFEMPDGPDVPKGLIGGRWQHTPCRPNGREVLAPWRPGWGVPGWKMVDGERVEL